LYVRPEVVEGNVLDCAMAVIGPYIIARKEPRKAKRGKEGKHMVRKSGDG
jgi:hypothetical protein